MEAQKGAESCRVAGEITAPARSRGSAVAEEHYQEGEWAMERDTDKAREGDGGGKGRPREPRAVRTTHG